MRTTHDKTIAELRADLARHKGDIRTATGTLRKLGVKGTTLAEVRDAAEARVRELKAARQRAEREADEAIAAAKNALAGVERD